MVHTSRNKRGRLALALVTTLVTGLSTLVAGATPAQADEAGSYLSWRVKIRDDPSRYCPPPARDWKFVADVDTDYTTHSHTRYKETSYSNSPGYYKTIIWEEIGVSRARVFEICTDYHTIYHHYSPIQYKRRLQYQYWNCHSGNCWPVFWFWTAWGDYGSTNPPPPPPQQPPSQTPPPPAPDTPSPNVPPSNPMPPREPPGLQTVTSVSGLSDGTLVETTDTRRMYKIVGGAPLWLTTCQPNFCTGPHVLASQSVVDRGPAHPRDGVTIREEAGHVFKLVGGAPIHQSTCDVGCGTPIPIPAGTINLVHPGNHLRQSPVDGSSAVDQRGRVYIFVGGAPLWQSHCNAPVNCGNPPRISDYSIDARDHMHRVPADGHLIQGWENGAGMPVAMTVGGARINFASEQEVLDTGFGSNWSSRVVHVSGHAYHSLGETPVDGTLLQGSGAGGPTPVAAMVSGARINYASPAEVVATGHGHDWQSKVRAIPARAFSLIPTRIPDGTVLRAPDATADSGIHPDSVYVIAGGARVGIASGAELAGLGKRGEDVRLIPVRVAKEMSTRIPNSTLVRAPDGNSGNGIDPSSVYIVAGGGRIGIASQSELVGLGYNSSEVAHVPARVIKAMPRRIGDNTVFQATDATAESGVSPNSVYLSAGGARIGIVSQAELLSLGYQWADVVKVPVRVVKDLPTSLRDGTLIQGWADGSGTGIADVYGGKRFNFGSATDVIASGFGASWAEQVVRIPKRVWDQTPVSHGAQVALLRPSGVLPAGQRLESGAELSTPDGQYKLVMQSDGNLVQFTADNPRRAIWSSSTAGNAGASAVLQRDGNLVVYAADNRPLWSSGTGGKPDAAYRLALQSDANLVIYAPDNAALWASRKTNGVLPAGSTLRSHWVLRAPKAHTFLTMQGDGNLVLFAPDGRALWSTRTGGNPGARAVVQRDGNLVVFSADNRVLWNAGTGGQPDGAYQLSVRDDGSVSVGLPGSEPLWLNTRLPRLTAGERDTLLPGWSLRSADGRYRLVMQYDGNLVEHGPDGAIWSTRTSYPGARAVMQADGNLVLYTTSGAAVWNSGSGGRPLGAYKLVTQNDANVVIYTADNQAIWSRHGN